MKVLIAILTVIALPIIGICFFKELYLLAAIVLIAYAVIIFLISTRRNKPQNRP